MGILLQPKNSLPLCAPCLAIRLTNGDAHFGHWLTVSLSIEGDLSTFDWTKPTSFVSLFYWLVSARRCFCVHLAHSCSFCLCPCWTPLEYKGIIPFWLGLVLMLVHSGVDACAIYALPLVPVAIGLYSMMLLMCRFHIDVLLVPFWIHWCLVKPSIS